MRLFVALDIDASIREKIADFMGAVRSFAPDVRWLSADSLHITLKFIGEKPDEEVPRIKLALNMIEARKVDLNIRGYGFFPTARAPRVFWIGIEASSHLTSLAAMVDEKLTATGIPKEEHAFNPHLTLARGGGGSGAPNWRKTDRPNSRFQNLQSELSTLPMPEFGAMTAREFFLYHSQLSPSGSKYTNLASFSLG